MEIWIVAGVLAGSMAMFVKNVVPIEIVALLAMIVLTLTRVLTPSEGFSGFGDPALVTIAAVFVLSAGLVQTGVTDYLAQKIERIASSRYLALLFLLMGTVTVISAFMNNVAATAILMPVVIGMARRTRIHPGKLLMPVAFGSMLGGTCTAIGTSTNMVLSTFLLRNGMEPFGLFEFSRVGLFIAAVGLLYMVVLGHRLLPQRGELSVEETYHLRQYISELVILEESPLVGKSIGESGMAQKLDLNLIGLIRGTEKRFVLRPDQILQAGDLLLVEGSVSNIVKIKDTYGIKIKPDFRLTDEALQDADVKLTEVVIAPRSNLIGKSLKEIKFRQRFNLVAIAVHRKGEVIQQKISQIPLQVGDVLLIQGAEADLSVLRSGNDFLLLEPLPFSRFRKRNAKIALLIFIVVIALGGLAVVPIVVAVMIGAILMVLSRCINLTDAYQSIHWPTIVLIASMSSIGTAMHKTGLAQSLASLFVESLGTVDPHAILAGFFLLTVLLTQPMSNAAAALIVAPIALSTATTLHFDPRPFIVTIALAASASFLTPLEPACALVYNPGRYRFIDYFKCGLILTILTMAVVLYFVPIFWPFVR